MGLIKSQNAPASLKPFSMADVETAAKRILLRARQQAEQLLADAQREADALKEQARAEGLREGAQQGRAEGIKQGSAAGQSQALAEHRQQLTEVLSALASAAAELDARRQELEAEALREVVQLAAAIARRVTKRQGLIDHGVLMANLSDAMRLVVSVADVRISIHPNQRAALEAALPHLRMEWPGLKHVDLFEDPTLSPGGCRISTRGGRVDADLDEQLDRVIAELLPEAEES